MTTPKEQRAGFMKTQQEKQDKDFPPLHHPACRFPNFECECSYENVTPKKQQAMKRSGHKAPISMLPPHALVEIAKVRKMGAEKYATWDWLNSREWCDYMDAIQRHQLAWLAGENLDSESGLSHLAHAACGLMFLMEFEASGAGTDNRGKGLMVPDFEDKTDD